MGTNIMPQIRSAYHKTWICKLHTVDREIFAVKIIRVLNFHVKYILPGEKILTVKISRSTVND